MREIRLKVWPSGKSHHNAKVGDVIRLGFTNGMDAMAYTPARISQIDPGDVELVFTFASLGEVRRKVAPSDKHFRFYWDADWARRFKRALPVFRASARDAAAERRHRARRNSRWMQPAELRDALDQALAAEPDDGRWNELDRARGQLNEYMEYGGDREGYNTALRAFNAWRKASGAKSNPEYGTPRGGTEWRRFVKEFVRVTRELRDIEGAIPQADWLQAKQMMHRAEKAAEDYQRDGNHELLTYAWEQVNDANVWAVNAYRRRGKSNPIHVPNLGAAQSWVEVATRELRIARKQMAPTEYRKALGLLRNARMHANRAASEEMRDHSAQAEKLAVRAIEEAHEARNVMHLAGALPKVLYGNPDRSAVSAPAAIEKARAALVRDIGRASRESIISPKGARRLRAMAQTAARQLAQGCLAGGGANGAPHYERALATIEQGAALLADLRGRQLELTPNPIRPHRLFQGVATYRDRIEQLRKVLRTKPEGTTRRAIEGLVNSAAQLNARAAALSASRTGKAHSQALSYMTVISDFLRRAEERLGMRKNPAQYKARSVPADRPALTDQKKARKTFEMWHDRAPARVTRVPGPPQRIPETLVKLGTLPEIIYESDKWGEGKQTYQHKTEHPRPILATDPDGQHLYIVGGKVKIEDRGLVG